jgi:hypothetical protein
MLWSIGWTWLGSGVGTETLDGSAGGAERDMVVESEGVTPDDSGGAAVRCGDGPAAIGPPVE